MPLRSSFELLFELGSTMLTSKATSTFVLWTRCADLPKPAHQCNGASRPACQCQHDCSPRCGCVRSSTFPAESESDEFVRSLYHTAIMMPTIGPTLAGSAASVERTAACLLSCRCYRKTAAGTLQRNYLLRLPVFFASRLHFVKFAGTLRLQR